jgi:hypothetical protein
MVVRDGGSMDHQISLAALAGVHGKAPDGFRG